MHSFASQAHNVRPNTGQNGLRFPQGKGGKAIQLELTQGKNWQNAKWWCLASLLLVPLVPDFAAPVFALVCTVYCIQFLYTGALRGQWHCLQLITAAFLLWRIVGIFYSKFWINGASITLLWILSFSGTLLIPYVIRDRKNLERAIFFLVLAGGIAGLIGVIQALLYNGEKLGLEIDVETRVKYNPFWHELSKKLSEMRTLLPQWVQGEIPDHQPQQISNRATSTFTNPVFFACFEVLVFPLAFYGFFQFKGWRKAVSLLSSVFILGGIAFSYSRGPYLALALGIAIMFFMGWRQVCLMLVAAPVFVLSLIPSGVLGRVVSILSTQDISKNTRLDIWDACLEILKDKWLFGMGTGVESLREILWEQYRIKQPHAHNLLLELLIENGVLGLLLFAAMLLVFLIDIIKLCRISKESKALGVAMLAGVVGFCACGVTDYIFFGPTLVQYFFMMLGLSLAAKTIYLQEQKDGKVQPYVRWRDRQRAKGHKSQEAEVKTDSA